MATLASKTMIYRGLGSGIIRVMKEGVKVEFVNEESANQFKTIIWRTTQKSGSTTQKSENTTQKSENTTQKELTTTQKAVLDYLKENPQAGRVEIAKCLGNVSEDGVKFIIGRLQQLGLLKREGGRKHGHWIVTDKDN